MRVHVPAAHVPDVDPAVEVVQAALRAPGTPLPPELLAEMEQRLGADLRDVRLHSDTEADRATRGLRARALTVGSDILFAGGRATRRPPRGGGCFSTRSRTPPSRRPRGAPPCGLPRRPRPAATKRARSRRSRLGRVGQRPRQVTSRRERSCHCSRTRCCDPDPRERSIPTRTRWHPTSRTPSGARRWEPERALSGACRGCPKPTAAP